MNQSKAHYTVYYNLHEGVICQFINFEDKDFNHLETLELNL